MRGGGHGLAGEGAVLRASLMCVAEEAEIDWEEEGRVPPCGDGSGNEVAREVRRAWAWRSTTAESSRGVESLMGSQGKKVGAGSPGGSPGKK